MPQQTAATNASKTPREYKDFSIAATGGRFLLLDATTGPLIASTAPHIATGAKYSWKRDTAKTRENTGESAINTKARDAPSSDIASYMAARPMTKWSTPDIAKRRILTLERVSNCLEKIANTKKKRNPI
jgi:hypothetical protein